MSRGKRERNCVHEPQCIVLDKSFVRSASSKQVREVCENYRALMPEDLFFELIHSDEVTKAKCFAKFPARENPVGRLPPVGVLIQHENEYRRPCTPLWNHRLRFNYRFNDKLATGEFELTHQQLAGVRKWEEDLAADTANFAERAKLIVARYYALGHTDLGRLLFVVYTLRGEKIRVISARDMTRREQKEYEHAQAQEFETNSEV